jgi:hypothetical protein
VETVDQELLGLIREHAGTMTPRQMGRRRRKWSDPGAAEMALRALARAGYGEVGVQSPPHRGRPSFRFKLFDKPPPDNNAETPAIEIIVSRAPREPDACLQVVKAVLSRRPGRVRAN